MSNLFSGNFPLLTFRSIDTNHTGQVVKAARGGVFSMYISNTGMAAAYVKLYNKATAPTSSDVPTHTLCLQPAQSITWTPNDGIDFNVGISVRATTEVADNGNTSPGTNEVVVNIEYL